MNKQPAQNKISQQQAEELNELAKKIWLIRKNPTVITFKQGNNEWNEQLEINNDKLYWICNEFNKATNGWYEKNKTLLSDLNLDLDPNEIFDIAKTKLEEELAHANKQETKVAASDLEDIDDDLGNIYNESYHNPYSIDKIKGYLWQEFGNEYHAKSKVWDQSYDKKWYQYCDSDQLGNKTKAEKLADLFTENEYLRRAERAYRKLNDPSLSKNEKASYEKKIYKNIELLKAFYKDKGKNEVNPKNQKDVSTLFEESENKIAKFNKENIEDIQTESNKIKDGKILDGKILNHIRFAGIVTNIETSINHAKVHQNMYHEMKDEQMKKHARRFIWAHSLSTEDVMKLPENLQIKYAYYKYFFLEKMRMQCKKQKNNFTLFINTLYNNVKGYEPKDKHKDRMKDGKNSALKMIDAANRELEEFKKHLQAQEKIRKDQEKAERDADQEKIRKDQEKAERDAAQAAQEKIRKDQEKIKNDDLKRKEELERKLEELKKEVEKAKSDRLYNDKIDGIQDHKQIAQKNIHDPIGKIDDFLKNAGKNGVNPADKKKYSNMIVAANEKLKELNKYLQDEKAAAEQKKLDDELYQQRLQDQLEEEGRRRAEYEQQIKEEFIANKNIIQSLLENKMLKRIQNEMNPFVDNNGNIAYVNTNNHAIRHTDKDGKEIDAQNFNTQQCRRIFNHKLDTDIKYNNRLEWVKYLQKINEYIQNIDPENKENSEKMTALIKAKKDIINGFLNWNQSDNGEKRDHDALKATLLGENNDHTEYLQRHNLAGGAYWRAEALYNVSKSFPEIDGNDRIAEIYKEQLSDKYKKQQDIIKTLEQKQKEIVKTRQVLSKKDKDMLQKAKNERKEIESKLLDVEQTIQQRNQNILNSGVNMRGLGSGNGFRQVTSQSNNNRGLIQSLRNNNEQSFLVSNEGGALNQHNDPIRLTGYGSGGESRDFQYQQTQQRKPMLSTRMQHQPTFRDDIDCDLNEYNDSLDSFGYGSGGESRDFQYQQTQQRQQIFNPQRLASNRFDSTYPFHRQQIPISKSKKRKKGKKKQVKIDIMDSRAGGNQMGGYTGSQYSHQNQPNIQLTKQNYEHSLYRGSRINPLKNNSPNNLGGVNDVMRKIKNDQKRRQLRNFN